MIDEETTKRLIHQGRDFMRGTGELSLYEEDFESDQDRRLPQPPLVKAAVTPKEEHIPLTRDFTALDLENDLLRLIGNRRSSRVYTDEEVSLEALSFLLWATQGVKSIRGKSYATLRTVPCGGARHEYETYLIVRKVTGIMEGVYHYLPMEHALERIRDLPEIEDEITDSLQGQRWTARASVVFYWAMSAYREEWRYGIFGHHVALIDAGHIGQNLYLGCTALGLGVCGIGAVDQKVCNRIFNLDGEEEFVVYAAPVGTIREADRKAEQDFYQFEEDENGEHLVT